MEIRERQNTPWALDRLVAQRWLYGRAKRVENLRLMSVLAVAVLLLSSLAVEADWYSQLATMIVVAMWFLDQAVMVRLVDGMKEEAAAIQEDFDCFVLNLPWPEHSGVERPTNDRVKELTRLAGGGEAPPELIDWYGGDEIPVEPTEAQLHCQRANCRWDGRLRREWLWFVNSVVGGSVVVVLFVATVAGVSLLEVVFWVAAGLRLAAWLMTERRAQSIARKRMDKLRSFLSQADGRDGRWSLCDIRLVQASIFEHRRVSPMVPDLFYRFRRTAHEALERG